MSQELVKLMAEVDTLLLEERAATQQMRELRAVLDTKLGLISTLVIEGEEKTGDRLLDLVLAAYGYNPKILERCRTLERMLVPVGECVLIQYHDYLPLPPRFWRNLDKEEATVVRVGILESAELRSEPKNDLIEFPVSRYVQFIIWHNRRYSSQQTTWQVVERNLFYRHEGDNKPERFGYQLYLEDKKLSDIGLLGDYFVGQRLTQCGLGGGRSGKRGT